MKKKRIILPSLMAITSVPFISLVSCNKQVTQSYLVHTVTTETIDWSVIPQAPINIFKWTKDGPQDQTFAQMAFHNVSASNKGFAIRIVTYDPDPLQDQETPGLYDFYKNCCLEAYFKFATEKRYFSIEVDSENNTLQEFGLPWSEGQGRTNLGTDAFITNAQVHEHYWDVTILLRLTTICEYYGRYDPGILSIDDFKKGFTFTGNFYSICATPGEHEHYGMWNDVENKDHTFHDPTQFGKFTIVD